jgi:general secretion pathway protein I
VRAARGFTLIEVLVALAIVTIGMAAVMGALNSSANTINYLRDKTFAQWVALNQIANIRISGQQPATGNSDGDLDYAGRSWHWRQEVVATDVPGLVRIDVKVRPKEIKADDDNGWFTTVSGMYGDAVGAPNGYQPNWGTQTLPGQGPPQQQARTGVGAIGAQGTTGMPGTTGAPGYGTPGTMGTPGGYGPSGPSSGTLGGSTLGAPDSFAGPDASPAPAPPPEEEPQEPPQ